MSEPDGTQRKPVNGEKGEQVLGQYLPANSRAPKGSFWQSATLWFLLFLRLGGCFFTYTSLLPKNTLCVYPDNSPVFFYSHTAVVVESLSRVRLFATPWTAVHQASLSFTISWSLLKFMSINSFESVMPSNYLVLCCPLLLLPSIFSSIRVFSTELALCIRWSKYWRFSFSISPSSGYSGLISLRKSLMKNP